jgi:hypothetical protein
MEFSDKLDKLGPAVLAVSKDSHGVEKNQENFKFGGYPNLEACIQAYRPLLNQAGLFITQGFGVDEHGILMVRTALVHAASGQFIKTETPMSPSSKAIEKDACQAYGSAYTYGRRYAYMAIMSAFPTDSTSDKARDDDANSADGIAEPRKNPSGLKEPKGKSVAPPKTPRVRKKKADPDKEPW